MDCPSCDFRFESVPAASIPEFLARLAGHYREVLVGTGAEALRVRPAPAVWSALEYACHVRDVLWNLRDRVLLALAEDEPVFAPIHREERVQLAHYQAEEPSQVAAGIALGSELLGLLYGRMSGAELSRTGLYAGVQRDVLWIGRQAVHESEHHLEDVRRVLR